MWTNGKTPILSSPHNFEALESTEFTMERLWTMWYIGFRFAQTFSESSYMPVYGWAVCCWGDWQIPFLVNMASTTILSHWHESVANISVSYIVPVMYHINFTLLGLSHSEGIYCVDGNINKHI
jgi:hypothetical protein